MAPVAGQIVSDNLTESEAQERASLLNDLRYGIDLELSDDPAAPTFRSSTRIDFEPPAGCHLLPQPHRG